MIGKRLGWLIRICVSVLCGIGAAELGLRLFWVKSLALGAGIEHPHFHHRLKPNESYHFTSEEFDVTVRTNRYGLRGADPVIPKPAGTVRILMLGDSFTFGFPVEDDQTFSHLIERDLTADGYPVEVVNGGVSGYAPTLHYIALRDEFLAFEPDLVVLWYDLGDLQEDFWFQKNLVYDERGAILRCDPRYIDGRFSWPEWWKHHSALVRYLDRKVLNTIRKIHTLGIAGYVRTKLRGERSKVAIARLKAAQHAEDLATSDRFLLVRPDATPEFVRPYWTLSRRYLVMIRDLLVEREVPFVLGLYPYGMLVGPTQWAEGRTDWGFEQGKTYAADAARSLFRQFSADEHVPLIDTFESFRLAGSSQKLFYDWDGHMTPEGHRVLATHVVRDPQFLAMLRERLSRGKQDAGPADAEEHAASIVREERTAVASTTAQHVSSE